VLADEQGLSYSGTLCLLPSTSAPRQEAEPLCWSLPDAENQMSCRTYLHQLRWALGERRHR
jgi:hypothetical protein